MKGHNLPPHLIALALITLLLSGCGILSPVSAPTETPRVTVKEVSFTTEDDVKLAGTLYLPGEEDIAVVLAHQGTKGTDQRSWQPFAELIAERGFAALTFDFRGRGQSGGYLIVPRLERDMRAAIGFLRDQGFNRIVCMGASMGGSACLRAALDTDLEGLVVIASPMNLGQTPTVGVEDFTMLTMPKLYVCAEDDSVDGSRTGLAAVITNMYTISPEPKEIRIFPGTAHGTYLFDTEYGDEFRKLLVDFLEGLR